MKILGVGLLVSIMALAQTGTKTVPQTEPTKWEYRTVHSDREVNDLVAAGWEFVSMTSDQNQNNYLLKRTKGNVDPTLIYDIQPDYTKEAFKKHIQGDVVLSLVVTKAGLPIDVKVVRPLDPGLDESAIAAVKQWRFRPATKDGQPVAYIGRVETHFRIIPGRKPRSWFIFVYVH